MGGIISAQAMAPAITYHGKAGLETGTSETKSGNKDSNGSGDIVVIPVDGSQQSEVAFECE